MKTGEIGTEPLVSRIRATRKYHSVVPELIAAIGRREMGRRKNAAEAEKATKRVLHQIAGAYLPLGLQTRRWGNVLRSSGPDGLETACRQILTCHTSTRERLPVMEVFYDRLLGDLPPIRSVMDLGCGLNPLAIPWMKLARGCTYTAWDIYEDLALLLEAFFEVAGICGRAQAGDVVHDTPRESADVALLLKLLPCVEQVDRGAAVRLLERLDARWLLVSFPVHTLGGRRYKGMRDTYTSRFLGLVRGRAWRVEQFDFPAELVFRVDTGR